MNLNFTMSELIKSDIAARYKINNMPDLKALDNLMKLVFYCVQPIRDKVGKKMFVSSGYRCPLLNTTIGGSRTSHHCLGCAIDFMIDGMTVAQAIDFIRKSGVKFTQLIDEEFWVHISYVPDNLKCEVLKYRQGVYTKCQ